MFCAGLVTASGGIDQGLNQQAWLGMLDAQNQGVLDRADYIESLDPRDRAKNLAALAETGYDVVISVGFSMGQDTAAAALQFPGTTFIGIDQPQKTEHPNLTGLLYYEDRGGFLAGALAAAMSRTGRIGAVCEEQFIDSVRRYCEGFRAGAVYMQPAIDVELAYREGASELLFGDRGWGSQTALQLTASGVDVLFAVGGGTAEAALDAAAGQDAAVIGAEYDLYTSGTPTGPRLLTSAIKLVRPQIAILLQRAEGQALSGGVVFGPMDLAPFHEMDGEVPAALADQLAAIRQGLENGSIRTGVPFQTP